ncbi:MAG: cytoplasmic protein [Coriobacteriia bacterium]|nr:cytoplasmic protein [Coriobacteriia bacterium]
MSDQIRTDIKTAGGGTFAGGTYGDVTFNGSGTINGDVDTITYRVNGAGTSNGRVKAQSIVVNGTAGFNGEVQANEFVVNGDANVRDGAGVGRLVVKGNLSIGGSVAAHEVELRGFLRMGGDCQAETFTGEGGFTVTGLLNAGNIDVAVQAQSSAREIGGERIVIRQPAGTLGSLTGLLTVFAEKRLTVETIEGDVVWLENTTANVVRGKNVTVGTGCIVDLVEYADSYTPAGTAQVKEARQVSGAGA